MHLPAYLLIVGYFACLCQGADIGALRARYNLRSWRHRYTTTNRVAFCRYGEYRRRECCYGWRNHGSSQCAPICEDGCVHGKCVGPNRCQCDKGYTGATCDRDFNECSTKPCSHRCVNGIGSFRCFCPTGHVLLEDKVTCHLDYRCHVDRCAYGCEQVGYDFRCLCPDGLKVSADGFHCEDIDECAEGLVKCPPDQRCQNTYGNYMCMCKVGYAFQLINRRLICKERDQCVAQGLVCDANAHCEEGGGDVKCVCNEGYVGDGKMCRRVERRSCADRPCFPGVVCTDIRLDLNAIDLRSDDPIKLYLCGPCPIGYTGDGVRCLDINECDTGEFECHADARCINTPGSYQCQCNEGFLGDGKQCIPLDQTTCASDPCFEGVRCFDVPIRSDIDLSSVSIIKRYRCGSCPAGYEGDGETCADRNECEEGTFLCHRDAVCVNTEGSYTCKCKEGFAGDGRVCIPLDPRTCADGPCFPGVECEDIPLQRILNSRHWRQLDLIKLFRCGPCPRGYQGDGERCEDIDECARGLDNCHTDATCINIPGSFQCVCNPGFAGDGVLCVPVDPRTCADQPCFGGRVVCRDLILENVLRTIDLTTTVLIKLFECGPCPEGYFGNGEYCEDINECALDLFECHEQATCVNTDGGYECVCNPGYAGDGKRCREIDPTTCRDRPCFGGVRCTDIRLDVGHLDLDSTDIIKLYQCGICPPGYRGDGEICDDIDECALGLVECHEQATCVNTDGGYECVCDPGYAGDGKRCREIDPTTCLDRPCFDGVRCTNIRLDVGRLDLDSTDIIKLYQCGICPPGYRGDGEICDDIDECLEGRFFCPENSTCLNVPGTYECVCKEGFFGDGQTCIPLDPRTCADEPCFEGVECTDVDPNTLDWRSLLIVKLYSCADCPEGYTGDGETCKKLPPPIIIPKFVNVTVVVTDAADLRVPLIPDAKITAYVANEKDGTTVYAAAMTAFNGITKIAVPHNETVLIAVEHPDHLSKSVSYKAYLSTNNTLSIELYEFNELTEFLWRAKTSRALEFGDLLRLDIPKGGLQLQNGERVSIQCRPLNITIVESPTEGPELIAGIVNEDTGAVELTGLEAYGMTELKCLVSNRRGVRRPPRDLAPFTISMPVNYLADDSDETPLYAWRYHDDKGYWVSEGEIARVTDVSTEGVSPDAPFTNGQIAAGVAEGDQQFRLMWQFEARNFTYSWWAFGRAWKETSCVTVRACYDVDCRFPVENALIELYGISFRYTASRYTGLDGTVCFPYKTGGRVLLKAPCINVEKEVALAEVMPPSDCGTTGNENIITAKGDGLVGVCAQEDILFPYQTQGYCGDPGTVDGAIRYGNDFTHGNEVIYVCEDPFSTLETNTRVCQKCGAWSGQDPTCYGTVGSDFSSVFNP